MKILLLLLISALIYADNTTKELSEYVNIRTYESDNCVEYSSRVVLYKNSLYRFVFIFKQKYDVLNNKTTTNYTLVKMNYYF